MNVILKKNFLAEAAIAAARVVKFGTADGQVVQAAAATDLLVGVTGPIAPAINERVDVMVAGIADVEYGGAVTRGQKLTADANGKAVAAAPAAGANVHVIGIAQVSGVAGDIGSVLIAPSVMQG